MQSKQVAVAGILTGAVMTGLGVIVLVAGLEGAQRPDRDPVIGDEVVEEMYPDVGPLPTLPAANLSEGPSPGPTMRPGGAAEDPGGTRYEPVDPDPTAVADVDRPTPPSDPADPAYPTESGGTAGPTPTSGPANTPDSEPTTEPPEEPTAEPTPTETETTDEEPQSPSLARTGG